MKLPRVTGSAYCLPEKIRYNDDPIFDWITKNNPSGTNLFVGYKERRVLNEGENLMTIMLPAAQMALKNAGKKAEDVDILIGTGSISEYQDPNELSNLHKQLGLPARAWVVPICNDYSNYNACLLIADSLLKAGFVKTVLICIGGNWTRNVNYHTAQSVSAGDGAGAVVMTLSDDKSKWHVVDTSTISATEYYGGMFTGEVQYNLDPPYQGNAKLYSDHFFQITEAGHDGFSKFGIDIAPNCVLDLLKKTNIPSSEISLLPNQSSSALITPWLEKIKPAQSIDTITTFANMTVATHIVNFAYAEEKKLVKYNTHVLFALGPDMHANAILLRRGD